VPRSDGSTKRLTKAAKKRYNQATMARRQAETRRANGSGGGKRGRSS
jgi:hypothetical protein